MNSSAVTQLAMTSPYAAHKRNTGRNNERVVEPDTRQRILNAAAKLFSERGFDGTSVRDIATELGIANPSIYYHFKSKADILTELLAEPLQYAHNAILEANKLTGEARTRKIMEGLLGSLEVNHGIVLAAMNDQKNLLEEHLITATEMGPDIPSLLAKSIAADHRELRVTMAIGAVQRAVTGLMRAATTTEDFIDRLREQREIIIELTLKILH
jgi:AcrR family transcriptional regulator